MVEEKSPSRRDIDEMFVEMYFCQEWGRNSGFIEKLLFSFVWFLLHHSSFIGKIIKRKHGGGKIKQIRKLRVHHNFWRHKYYFQTVRKIVFVRGSPAQKTRVGAQLECSNTQGLQAWKRCQQAQALTAMVWQWLRSTQSTLQPKICINWGILHCFRAKTWLHVHWHHPNCSTSLQTPLLPLKKNLKVVRGGCYESMRPCSGQVGRYNTAAQMRSAGCNSPAVKALPTSSFH